MDMLCSVIFYGYPCWWQLHKLIPFMSLIKWGCWGTVSFILLIDHFLDSQSINLLRCCEDDSTLNTSGSWKLEHQMWSPLSTYFSWLVGLLSLNFFLFDVWFCISMDVCDVRGLGKYTFPVWMVWFVLICVIWMRMWPSCPNFSKPNQLPRTIFYRWLSTIWSFWPVHQLA